MDRSPANARDVLLISLESGQLSGRLCGKETRDTQLEGSNFLEYTRYLVELSSLLGDCDVLGCSISVGFQGWESFYTSFV
jgi:hypothetical protein